MNNNNNSADISENSRLLLNTLIKTARYYALCIGKIFPVPKTGTGEDLQREIALPYMVLIYGKILTVYRLLNGYSLEDLHPKQIGVSNDPYSCYDLVRSLYECFLQSNFVISRYQTEDQKAYMGLWWHIRAYSERSIMAHNRGMDHPKLTSEENDIATYKAKINKDYSDQKSRDETDFGVDKKQGLPTWPKPGKLYEMAGVHKTHHNHIYKMNSLFAHAEPFALMQLDAHFRERTDDLDGNILTHGTAVMYFSVMALKSFSLIFEPVEKLFLDDTDLQSMYESGAKFYGTDLSRKVNIAP